MPMSLIKKRIKKSDLAELAKERYGDLVNFQHPSLAAGRWFTLTLAEQLGNIGSEVHRVILARGDESRYDNAVLRAFELFYLTLCDERWKNRRREITRAREIFCDALLGGKEYGSTLEGLDSYFFHFAVAARTQKLRSRASAALAK